MSYTVASWVKQILELLKEGKILEAVYRIFASTIGEAVLIAVFLLPASVAVYFR